MSAVLGAVGRAAAGVRWYLREVSGESAYDRYVEHSRRHDARDRTPQQRCC